MRRVLVRWQRSGLTLREFGEKRGIPLSTLTWWRQVFRRADEQMKAPSKSVPASDTVVFTEVPQPATVLTTPFVVEIVLLNGHLLRVLGGADIEILQRVLQTLQTTC
jgi:hypothetical protein